MPKLHWALLCQQAVIDKNTNATSYLNAVEELGVESFPTKLPTITVATIWRRESDNGSGDEEINMRIKITGPIPDPITFEANETFGDFKRFRINRGLGGIPVEEPGAVVFYIQHKDEGEWNTRWSIPVEISSVESS